MRFRDARGDLAGSMAAQMEFADRAALVDHLRARASLFPDYDDLDWNLIEAHARGMDKRTGWDTWLIVMPGAGPQGYTDGPIDA